MPRDICYTCRRPLELCMCPKDGPMPVRTKIVLLMHEKEYKHQRSGTGRLACLNLKDSEILPGLGFDEHPRYRALVDDPSNYCCLLYPGIEALNLSTQIFPAELLEGRRLVVFLIDATWACAKKVLRASPSLLELPRLQFTPTTKSRWLIKRQPADWCLSTIESIHELLLALEKAGAETYEDKERLINVFMAMQHYQIERAQNTSNPRYRGM